MKIEAKVFIKYILTIFLLGVVYHLAARLGLQMAFVQANTSPVWPPSGIGLAALLLLGIRYWPGVTLGVVVGALITGAPLKLAIGLGLANTLEALIGAFLFRKFIGSNLRLETVREVIGLVAIAAVSTSVSASLGVGVLIFVMNVSQPAFFTLWLTWWIGNLLGVLVITPLLLIWVNFFSAPKKQTRIFEGILFILLLIAVTMYVFETTDDTNIFHQALIYVIFPFAIWAALRLEQLGAVTTITLVSGIAIWGTVRGFGPFSRLPINESLIILQTFTGVVALTSLVLAASASERRSAATKLNRRVEDLAALNDASKEFLANLDKLSLYNAICRLVVERLGMYAAWIVLERQEHPAAVDQRRESLKIFRQGGHDKKFDQESLDIQIQQALQKIYETGSSIVLDHTDFDNVPAGHRSGDATKPFAGFPLIYAGKVIGILCVIRAGNAGFSNEQKLLLESYANLAVVAMQNSWLFEQVRLGNEQLHALSQRLLSLQEQERMHLSRELHDETGQILAGLMVRIGLLERDIHSSELMAVHIKELRQIVTEVLNNLHTMAVKLRPASLDHLGLITALKQYIQDYSRQYGLHVQFDAEEIEDSRLSRDIETSFYRIVQESLTNVALHANANNVDILINRRNNNLVMTIEDDGVGFDPNPIADENRLGLFGMRERVEMLDGNFLVESSPGKGTTIVVEVPYDNSSNGR